VDLSRRSVRGAGVGVVVAGDGGTADYGEWRSLSRLAAAHGC
jgi:hypothetical protein